jgi:hypothetical protein
MAFAEDLAPFFDTDELAVDCTVGGVSVRAIFDSAHAFVAVGEAGMASSRPQIMLASAALSGSVVGQAVTVDGQAGTFTVAEEQPDGTGITVLILEAT